MYTCSPEKMLLNLLSKKQVSTIFLGFENEFLVEVDGQLSPRCDTVLEGNNAFPHVILAPHIKTQYLFNYLLAFRRVLTRGNTVVV